jgi:hypothetical protein
MSADSTRQIAARAARYAFEQLPAKGQQKPWRVTRTNLCPMCKSSDWCRVDPAGKVALCARVDTGGEPFGDGGDHLHILDAAFFGDDSQDFARPEPPKPRPKPEPLTWEERNRRHIAYGALLTALPLATGHEHLAPLAAKFPGALDMLCARVAPARESEEAAEILRELKAKHGWDLFRGVPGFAHPGKLIAAFSVGCAALVLPCFGAGERIEGLQLRRLASEGPKYIWFSGDDFGGSPRDASNQFIPVSIYRPQWGDEAEFILVTEGAKKAATATEALGCYSVSIPGVTQWRAVPGALADVDPDRKLPVRLAFDMDQDENEHVARALETLTQAMKALGRRVEIGRWPREWKGLDDALLADAQIEWISDDETASADPFDAQPADPDSTEPQQDETASAQSSEPDAQPKPEPKPEPEPKSRRQRLEEIAQADPEKWSTLLAELFASEAGEDKRAADALIHEAFKGPFRGKLLKSELQRIAAEAREAVQEKRQAERAAAQKRAQEARQAEREAARAAGKWWVAQSEERPRYESREDGKGGVEVIEWSKNREGEDVATILATCVYREIETRQPSDAEGEPLSVFEVFGSGRTTRFEANPGASMSKSWLETIRQHAPGQQALDVSSATINALNFLAKEISKAFPPQEVTVHAPGFDAKLESYRVPGWVVTAQGFEPESDSAICARGFGEDEKGGFKPDLEGRQLRETAHALQECWPELYPSRIDATIALAGGLCAPMLAPLAGSEARLVLALVGGTGSGKTTNARLLRSFHGINTTPNARNTIKGAIKAAELCRDSLAYVDDLREGASISDFVSSAFDGAQRVTSTKDQKLKRSPALRAGVVLTAETLCGAVQSTENRLVTIKFAPARPECLPLINAAKARLTSLENPSALVAEAVRLALAAGRGWFRARLREFKSVSDRHPCGSARAGDLGALVGLCAQLLREAFISALGEAPAWLASPAECMDRVLSVHDRAEKQAKPSVRFLDALHQAMISRAEFRVIECRWKRGRGQEWGKTVESLSSTTAGLDRGETLVLRIVADDENKDSYLFIAPRTTLQTLKLENLSEGQIRESLVNDKLLETDGEDARRRLWITGLGVHLRGWLIRDAAPAPSNNEGPQKGPRAEWLKSVPASELPDPFSAARLQRVVDLTTNDATSGADAEEAARHWLANGAHRAKANRKQAWKTYQAWAREEGVAAVSQETFELLRGGNGNAPPGALANGNGHHPPGESKCPSTPTRGD